MYLKLFLEHRFKYSTATLLGSSELNSAYIQGLEEAQPAVVFAAHQQRAEPVSWTGCQAACGVICPGSWPLDCFRGKL